MKLTWNQIAAVMVKNTSKLKHILPMGKASGDHHGLRYTGECSTSKTIFVKGHACSEPQPVVKKNVSEFRPQRRKFIPICHYCNHLGHIRPQCYKYLNDFRRGMCHSSSSSTRKMVTMNIITHQVWVRKANLVCHVAYTSLKASSADSWYFDSDCSKHMTRESKFLKNIQTCTEEHVTFGDGVKGRVLGKRVLDVEGVPRLKNVLLVERLKANLISISQLCDQDLHVKFSKNKCLVFDKSENCVMEGSRSSDNCYILTSSFACYKTILDATEIWHQKLGHLNYRNLRKIASIGVVKGIPKLKQESTRVCGPCQVRKQKKMLHKVLQQISTTRVLELLHMDLMGPM